MDDPTPSKTLRIPPEPAPALHGAGESGVGSVFAARPSDAGGWQPPTPEDLQLSFSQYEIRGILGCGGMGAVYKGWHKRLERFVAIKILPRLIDDGGMNLAERFKQEAAAMAKFRHPGIVAVHDAGETPDGLLYFTMELMEGTDVAQLVAKHGRLPVAQAVGIACRVCEALAYAHERGVIHRDIKPSNVMIEADGTVKLADFGLAKFPGAEKHVSTGSGLTIGTPDFMPPEALQGSRHVDQRGDIYATGGLLYQMLTGKVPHGRFEPPSMVIVGLDKRLDAIVDKAMQPDPDKRYANAIEFLTVLTRIASTLKKPANGGTQTPGEPHRRSSAKRVMVGVIAIVLLGIAAVAFGPWKKGGAKAPAGNTAQAGADGKEAGGLPTPGIDPKISGSSATATGDRGAHGPDKAAAKPADASTVRWHDAFAESPMKEVIAKAEHTAHGYLLPDNNHWPISPPSLRSGAVRVRATAFGGKFLSLYIPHNDRTVERVRFRDQAQAWVLSHGTIAVAETDGTSKSGSSPLDGKPHDLLFARFGGRLRVMLDGHLLHDEADPSSLPGRFTLDIFEDSKTSVEKVEYLELDGVPESEALKLIGMDAGGKELPAATGVSIATANAPKAEPWVDLFRPDAAVKLQLDGIEKAGPEGMVVPANAKATVAGTGGPGSCDGALRLRARFEPVSNRRVSIRARSMGGPGYGLMVINPSKLVLQVWRGNGIVETLKEFALSDPLPPGQDYEMELRAVGSKFTARLNGRTLGQVEDTTFPLGAFQVRAGAGDPVTIRGLEYLDLSASSSAVGNSVVRSSEGGLAAVTKEAPFVNSLGMKFIPVPITGGPTSGKRVLFSVWETRVQDYEAFVKETQRAWPKPSFGQGPTHPVVKVNWDDAQAFCAWLTERERKAGKLAAGERYRLPTDNEWSCAAGIGEREDPAIGPAKNSGKLTDVFPWGTAWPPPPGAGNYSGEEAAGHEMAPDQKILAGFRDGFSESAPAGSFAANALGISDLGGNAWEWCEDFWKPGEPSRVVRGGSFGSARRDGMFSSYRDFNPPEARNSSFGFRVVVGPIPAKPATAAAKRWRDAFAESPLKEVIAKSGATADGYPLPGENHWFITPESHGSGAVRVRVTKAAGKFVTIFFAHDDRASERIRFREQTGEWVLSKGTGGIDETDFASKTAASPLDGQPHELVFARIGGRLRVLVDGQLLHDEADPSPALGRFVLDLYRGAEICVDKLEYADLDGVPESEALALLGIGKK